VDRRHVLTGLLGVAGHNAARPKDSARRGDQKSQALYSIRSALLRCRLFQASPDVADAAGTGDLVCS
jgi:hypothetical protein